MELANSVHAYTVTVVSFYITTVYCIVHIYSPFPFCSVFFFCTLLCVFVVCFFLFEDLVEVQPLLAEGAFLHKKEEEGKWGQRSVHRGVLTSRPRGYAL